MSIDIELKKANEELRRQLSELRADWITRLEKERRDMEAKWKEKLEQEKVKIQKELDVEVQVSGIHL